MMLSPGLQARSGKHPDVWTQLSRHLERSTAAAAPAGSTRAQLAAQFIDEFEAVGFNSGSMPGPGSSGCSGGRGGGRGGSVGRDSAGVNSSSGPEVDDLGGFLPGVL